MDKPLIFRITSRRQKGEMPAFSPVEDGLSFEDAYRNFIYQDEAELFAELVTFNRFAFMFQDFEFPEFDNKEQAPGGEDVIRHGLILEDGSIRFSDGQIMPVDAIWESYGLNVPNFGSSFAL